MMTDLTTSDRFIAESLLNQLAALLAEIPGVRQADDPECLHRMRVASRRLRNMLELFSPWLPAKMLAGWRKQVKRVTRTLGAARDLDVQLQFISDFHRQTTAENARYGLARLLLRLRQQRNSCQPQVLSVLAELEDGRMTGEMEQYLRQLRIKSQLHPEADSLLPLLKAAENTITNHLTEMLSYEIFLESKPNFDNQYLMLHAMRIAAKHLRYSMTLFAPLYPDGLQETIKTTRTIQDHLGELHDCDVWISTLPQFLREEKERILQFTGSTRGMGRISSGIDVLLSERISEREKILQNFRQYWQQQQEKNIWPSLLTIIHNATTAALADESLE